MTISVTPTQPPRSASTRILRRRRAKERGEGEEGISVNKFLLHR